MSDSGDPWQERLRRARIFGDAVQRFDPASAPATPEELFRDWLDAAIEAGVDGPQTMTLSTVDADGRPDARIVLLRGLQDGGWRFATSRLSPKARQLARVPYAAATFHWPAVGRQVRLRGPVQDGGPQAAVRDFLARSPLSQAEASSERQSSRLGDLGQLRDALATARADLDRDPETVPAHWTVFQIVASEVEFWQAADNRCHVRLIFRRSGDSWVKELLWP